MSFSRQRGRPKRTTPIGKDKGTAELQFKRALNLTMEPLDLCFSKGLITDEQRNAGSRFRWLYTLKFGAPTVSAYDPGHPGGKACKHEDSKWLANRHAEYNHIIQELERNKCRKITTDTCILEQMPSFLTSPAIRLKRTKTTAYKELNRLIYGLDLISGFFKKQN